MISSKVLSEIPGLLYGFGTAQDPIPQEFNIYWKNRPHSTQAHGTRAIEISSFQQECGEGDAFISSIKSTPLAIATADCVPILLTRKDGGKIAAIHAGWRGTKSRILISLWEKLQKQGEVPSEWVASIGPAIGPCCYEVNQELAKEFKIEFKYFDAISLHGKSNLHSYTLDLPKINAMELEEIGLKEIELIRACTHCSTFTDVEKKLPLFNSYRRDKTKERQFSVIMKI